jgi:DNA replication initiation complex subunit (GINS family)
VIELYNELYNTWRSEKNSPLPTPLPDDFFKRATNYLEGLQEDSGSSDPHSAQGRLLIREKEIAGRLLVELKQTRFRKILENAKNGVLVKEQNLMGEERTLLRDLSEFFAVRNEDYAKREDIGAAVPRPELTVVRFLMNIPEIVGTDLRIYGPYKKEDVGSLPAENAHALVEQGAAKVIEVKGLSQH